MYSILYSIPHSFLSVSSMQWRRVTRVWPSSWWTKWWSYSSSLKSRPCSTLSSAGRTAPWRTSRRSYGWPIRSSRPSNWVKTHVIIWDIIFRSHHASNPNEKPTTMNWNCDPTTHAWLTLLGAPHWGLLRLSCQSHCRPKPVHETRTLWYSLSCVEETSIWHAFTVNQMLKIISA